jgi:hypothetical protein
MEKGLILLRPFLSSILIREQLKSFLWICLLPFIKGAQQTLPWANIIPAGNRFDKWHVFKLFQRHLDELSRRHRTIYIQLLFELLKQFYSQKKWQELWLS